MKRYIAYIDILGVKNSSETQNYDYYLRLITDFQNELLRVALNLKEGRIHFFSDCVFIESKNLESLILSLRNLRELLFDSDPSNEPTFIRGAITSGILGAINSNENQEFIDDYYQDKEISKRYRNLKKTFANENIKGTLFLSKDTAKLVELESKLKGSAFNVDYEICHEIINQYIVNSGYISNIGLNDFVSFKDISYEPDDITEDFLDILLKTFYKSNIYNVSYGRYYLTILISCINSVDFSNLEYDDENNIFNNTHAIFEKVLQLRREYSELYNKTKGLEFVYFTLINKVYLDLNTNNNTTKEFLKQIFLNRKHLGKYSNRISSVPTTILSTKSKNLMIRDFISNIED